ncbi:MAG: hypothetical protein QXO02_07635 [Thermofilaceae archaeon]
MGIIARNPRRALNPENLLEEAPSMICERSQSERALSSLKLQRLQGESSQRLR